MRVPILIIGNHIENVPKQLIDMLLAERIKDPDDMPEEQIKREMIHLIAAVSAST